MQLPHRGGQALEGDFLWRLKDEIDRKWMSMYQKLPNMEDMNEDVEDSTDAVAQESSIPPILAGRAKGSEAVVFHAYLNKF